MSPLDPHSPEAHHIATLWWWMLVVAAIVFLGAVAMLVLGWLRRDRPGLPLLGESERANTTLVVAFGMAIPIVILVALFVVSDLVLMKETDAPDASETAMSVTVVGHQWWWEVRYGGSDAVTANEIHIPARTRIDLIARSADVIHSFWVPELNRKIDMIPGQANSIKLYAEEPGVYRGQCAEFCGLQHAHMAFRVYAEHRRASANGWRTRNGRGVSRAAPRRAADSACSWKTPARPVTPSPAPKPGARSDRA